MSGVGDNTILNWTAELAELDDQIEALQQAKKDFYANVRDEHGKKQAASLKEAMRLHRMDSAKRQEAEEIDAEAFRILQVIESGPSRASRVRVENIEQFDADTGEFTDEPAGTESQTIESVNAPIEMVATDGNTGGDDVDGSANARPAGQETGAQPSGIEDGITVETVKFASGPDVKRAPNSNTRAADKTGEGQTSSAPASILGTSRAEKILMLRPHCQNPDACRSSGGKDHCFTCRTAMAEREKVSA